MRLQIKYIININLFLYNIREKIVYQFTAKQIYNDNALSFLKYVLKNLIFE